MHQFSRSPLHHEATLHQNSESMQYPEQSIVIENPRDVYGMAVPHENELIFNQTSNSNCDGNGMGNAIL